MSQIQRKLALSELAPYNVIDGELLTAIRFGGEVYAGARQGGALADRHSWIYGRYGEFKDATYEGFWAFRGIPNGVSARAMSIVGASRSDLPESPDLWTAPLGASLELGWEVHLVNAVGDTHLSEMHVWNARTGAESVLSNLTPAGAYCVWLRLAARSAYRGLPPDFESVSGLKADDARWLWREAGTGHIYQFVPDYAVGALPPSGALREHYNELLVNGKVIKVPEWISFLFDPQAANIAALQHTEWSMVRLVVLDANGAGEWPDESEVDVGACPGAALLKLEAGALVPHPLRASLRSIGAFKEIDGELFVGAMEAGTDGRYASIIECASLGSSEAARGQTLTERRICECVLLNETVHALARFPDRAGGTIYGATSCELFERADSLPPGKRLIGSDPGGRSLVVCKPLTGHSYLARAVESDFSANVRSWASHSFLVVKTALGQHTGPGITALYNSVLWEWNGRVWGITDADPDLWNVAVTEAEKTRATSFQSLCWFDGAAWHKVARWPGARFYLSRGGACGERMLLFGRRESDKRPICFRFDGQTLESNIELPYYVERADSTVSADGKRQNLLLTCVKADPNMTDNTVLPGFFLVETAGEFDHETLTFCCSSDLPDGTCASWCLPRSVVEAVVSSTELLGCYAWSGACWKKTNCDIARAETVWLQVEVSEATVCFVRHGGPLPYSSLLYECLEWSSDGDCIVPVPTCEDALCAWNLMPAGTRVYVGRYSGETGELAAPLLRFAVTDGLSEDGALMCAMWPCVWARADAPAPFPLSADDVPTEAMLADMANFQTRVPYGAPVSLQMPATKWVDVLVFVPPGFQWETVLQPL